MIPKNAAVWVSHRASLVKWEVRRVGASHAIKLFDTQREAIKRGRSLAMNQKVELIVIGLKGQILRKDSYGNDPREIKG